VYQGWWRGGSVAIKVVAHEGDLDGKVGALRESLLCSSIQHPHVVRAPCPPCVTAEPRTLAAPDHLQTMLCSLSWPDMTLQFLLSNSVKIVKW
jgi:hypothetical protein